MKLQTPVTDAVCKVGISYKDKITMLGSCFSDNIGSQLADFGFDVCVNPFGTLYNPVSILKSVERLISGEKFTEKDCIQIGAGDERFCSFSHHTSFARKTTLEFLENANSALENARRHFAQSTKIIITLGTSWCFRNNASGEVVSNCLKRLAGEFTRERLSATETTACLGRIMEICRMAEGTEICGTRRELDYGYEECKQEGSENKSETSVKFVPKQFIFTVSPIRHFKDGAHGNQISKAGLLLGIEDAILHAETTSGSPLGEISKGMYKEPAASYVCDYFPAYEIMMDQLRDYRFYAEDMCHPSAQAVNYIRERFLDWALDPSERSLLEENIKKFKRSSHIAR